MKLTLKILTDMGPMMAFLPAQWSKPLAAAFTVLAVALTLWG